MRKVTKQVVIRDADLQIPMSYWEAATWDDLVEGVSDGTITPEWAVKCYNHGADLKTRGKVRTNEMPSDKDLDAVDADARADDAEGRMAAIGHGIKAYRKYLITRFFEAQKSE